MADDADTGVYDSGVSDDVVTITAPAHTLNWAMVGIVALAVWWVYSQMDAQGGDDYEDE
jgi:hypothetical protein